MSEKGGFENTNLRPELERPTPFHEQLRPESEIQRHGLQSLSPDKRVYEAGDLSNLSSSDRNLLQRSLTEATDQWQKVGEPLRNVFNNWKRQEISGDTNGTSEKYAKNYMDKVADVLRDNMAQVSAEVPFRVAIKVWSCLPGPTGRPGAEILYAFFPPLQTDIQERYVTMPLHSPDPAREAALRKDVSLANSISSHELQFRFKVGSDILSRREKIAE